MLGWTPDELLPNPFIEIIHPGDREAVETEVARLGQGGTTAEFKIRICTKDGGWRWTEWSASPDLERGSSTASGARSRSGSRPSARSRAERRQLADAQQIASVGSWELDVEYAGADLVRPAIPQPRLRSVELGPRGRGGPRAGPPRRPREGARAVVARSRPASTSSSTATASCSPTAGSREIETEGRPFVDDDGSRRLMGTSRDVTAERDAERLKDDFFGLDLARATHPADLDHRLHGTARRDRGRQPE